MGKIPTLVTSRSTGLCFTNKVLSLTLPQLRFQTEEVAWNVVEKYRRTSRLVIVCLIKCLSVHIIKPKSKKHRKNLTNFLFEVLIRMIRLHGTVKPLRRSVLGKFTNDYL